MGRVLSGAVFGLAAAFVAFLLLLGWSRSVGVVDDLVEHAVALEPPDAVELARSEKDTVRVFAGSDQSGAVSVLWASDRSPSELWAFYDRLDVLGDADAVRRGDSRVEYTSFSDDRNALFQVIVYLEVPARWPSFDEPATKAPNGKTIVLVSVGDLTD